MFNKTISIFNKTISIICSVNFFLRFSRHDLLNQGLSDLLQGAFLFLVGKTPLAVHLKMSQILSITSFIQF
jgi:hypothetical protein